MGEKFEMIKAIIFDCDGTLVDSEEFHFYTWQAAIQNLGGDLSLEEYTCSYVGKPGLTIARSLAEKIGHDRPDEIFNKKTDYFLEYLHQGLPPIQGTIKFIRHVIEEKQRSAIKLGVASAASRHEILINLKELGLNNAFDVVLSGHDDLTEYEDPEGVNKPKPYIYLHAAKLLGISPHECIVVEDSHTGVLSGRSAGCITIAVPNSFSKHQDLSAATLIFESLSDLTLTEFLEIIAGRV